MEKTQTLNVGLLSFMIELFNTKDKNNRLLAYCILNTIKFDYNKKVDRFFMKIFWFNYTGESAYGMGHLLYEHQQCFYNYIKGLGPVNWLQGTDDEFNDLKYKFQKKYNC